MKAEDKAKANLKRTTKQTVKKMLAAVKQATKDVEALIAEHVRQTPYGWMDAGRESTYAAIDAHFKSLRKSLDVAIGGLVRASASTGSLLAEAQSKGAVVRFSEEHLQAYLERVTPKNAPSLAAVYTASMSASVKAALRETAVHVFTQGAAAGLTMHEQARQFQAEWALRAKDRNPYRFVDKRGRAWENARYIQMLTRTTAQRVETAAFCDSMLASGFPVARISNDSGNDCGICAQWEGRLIDLSAGHQLGSGTYTLQEAREAGLFHPNCTHRLEYVSVSEIPDALWEKIKDKIGVPGAFGDNKTATKPDLPTKKQAQEHIKQVETAAEEKAKEPIDPLSPEAIEEAVLQGDPLGGSTGARLITAPDGKKYVVKAGASEAHVQNEMAADALYRAAGINVPAFRAVRSTSGKLYKVAEFIEGKDLQSWWDKASPADRRKMTDKLAQGMDVDAMLGNWDVIGASGDNILVDKDGNPWRIDNGGSMGYRAQGAKKTGDQWNQWTDDFFTIATSPNNKKYVGQTSAGWRLMRAARRDWDNLTKDLPKEDRDAILARLKEVKEQAARANDLIDGDYTYKYTDSVLKAANDLCKSGYREAVPKRIDEGNFGNCRPDAKTSSAKQPDTFKKQVQFAWDALKAAYDNPKNVDTAQLLAQTKDIVEKALAVKKSNKAFKSMAAKIAALEKAQGKPGHIKYKALIKKMAPLETADLDLIPDSPIQTDYGFLTYKALTAVYKYVEKGGELETDKLNKLYSKENELQKIYKGTGDAGAKHYIDAIAKIKAWVDNKEYNPGAISTLVKVNQRQRSLTERAIDYIGKKDWDDYIAQWTGSQAGDSWNSFAIKRKVVEFHAMGIDAKTLDKAAAEMDGVWNGVTNDGGNKRARSFKKVRGSMTEGQIERFAEIDAKMRAATMLMLENADFNGNVRNKRKVVLFRTENEEAVFGDKKPTEKQTTDYDTSAAESFSFNETVYVYSDCAIACAVPYSRISASYFMARDKAGNDMFYGDDEKEFNVNAIGLDRVFISRGEKMHTTTEIMQDPEIMQSLGLT